MKNELWVDLEKQDRFFLAGSAGDAALALLEPGSSLEWTLDADCHFDAMTNYYEYRVWVSISQIFLIKISRSTRKSLKLYPLLTP